MTVPTTPDLRAIAALLSDAESALFITGAGLSADSGLPTYRGIGGLYEDNDTEEGLPIEAMLSGTMMRRAPEKTWKYIHQIERACRGAAPNAAHEFITWLSGRVPRTVVLTQNVDGLHDAAGNPTVIAIHGDVHDLRCTRCDWKERVANYTALEATPRCPRCATVIRPEVVLFGEALPSRAVAQLELQLQRGFDVVFTVGTTSVFPYIAYPVVRARELRVPTVEVNPGESDVSHIVDYRVRAGAAETFSAVRALMETTP